MYERLSKRVQGRRDEGFTLIELLIVIVILGILAAIVVFAIGGTRGDSVASSCKTNKKSIELSAEAIKTKKGLYPQPTTALATYNKDTAVADNLLLAGNSADNGALIKDWPNSDDVSFVYDSADGKTYTIEVVEATSSGLKGGLGADACDKA